MSQLLKVREKKVFESLEEHDRDYWLEVLSVERERGSRVFEYLPDSVYHGGPGISTSGLKLISRSPKHFLNREDISDKDAVRFGRMLHMAVLEPSEFDKRYVSDREISELGRTAKGFKDAVKAYLEENPTKEVVKSDWFENITGMRESLFSSDIGLGAMKSGKREVAAYHFDMEHNLLLKAKADYLRSDNVIIDIKTCKDARREAFEQDAYFWGYHLQCAVYGHVFSQALGVPVQGFVFIAIEKNRPYEWQMFVADEGMIDAGQAEMRRVLADFSKCYHSDQWPGYDKTPVPLGLPHFAWRLEEQKEASYIS